jgi:hypothetical protein
LTNAADELARGGCGRGRNGGDDARAAPRQTPFDSKYDDVEILGKLVTRGDHWRPIGFVLHVQNGAIFGAAYARLKPSLPGPAVLRGLLVGLIEHVAAWPMTVVFDRYHPARKELPKLAANRRAFGQATIRHAVGQADYVLIAEIVEVERFEQQASEHVQRLADDLAHLVSSRGMLVVRPVL